MDKAEHGEREQYAAAIADTGFTCSRCGACCLGAGVDASLVIVAPPEIRRIIQATGLDWNQIVEPFPEPLTAADGSTYTFEWALRRSEGRCIFAESDRCTIHPYRPWICRTYPFMLDGDRLVRSECNGYGESRSVTHDDLTLADDLIARRDAEELEEIKVREIYRNAAIPAGCSVVIDGEGMKVLDG
ncbi:YkgJ family cysteine cluster protein [Methanosphaerula palustris]|uniref:YkgJ family cysteine cluster protein n=1 Tax=Methanosphaerula palustris (strain ATCC BAA-1556 / DSM 19958 / E1-9c) TaxID=521011 RepID=B8GIP6_METPE|nr:YkgJ family cysteine cluster protein [Methanosphaerula palustris]ACL16859.1 protein of unknown function UPF0153 [Methanosphaerula palustris E1-9c]